MNIANLVDLVADEHFNNLVLGRVSLQFIEPVVQLCERQLARYIVHCT